MSAIEFAPSMSMFFLLALPFALQTGTMMVDEFHFHRERGLPLWERIGHPLDTLTVVICYGFVLTAVPSREALPVFLGLACFSLLFTAKDEPIHARLCRRREHQTHIVLFVLHPLVLGAAGLLWWQGTPAGRVLLQVQAVLTTLFMIHQIVYWNLMAARQRATGIRATQSEINSHVYDTLGEGWYDANADPIALLRAESRLRNPWIEQTIFEHFRSSPDQVRVLDIGCGGGFLANYLADRGFSVHAIDRSGSSLQVAARHDGSGQVRYQAADAFRLPYPDATFDTVCAMDFLEHVEDPRAIVREASRVLRPNGLFFFYTHNRNWLSAFLVIKGVNWFVRNTPENLHLYRLFIKPRELRKWCSERGIEVKALLGVRPHIFSSAFAGLLLTRTVPEHFEFRFTRSLGVSYVGYALKPGS